MAPSPRTVPVWRNHDFLPLWIGLQVSNLGDWINYVAMYAVVYQQTHSARALVGLRLVHITPELLFAPFAGVLVDRWSRKKTLTAAPFVSAVFVSLLVFAHQVVLIYIVEAALTIAAMFFDSAVSAAMPNIVPREDLVHANTLSRITSTLAILVGGLTGGILVSSVGAPLAFGLDAVSFLVIAVLVTTVHVREGPRPPSVSSVRRQLLEGILYLRERPLIATVVMAGAIVPFAPSAMFTVGIVFAQAVLHAGSGGYGVLLAGLGTGSFAGAMWMIRVRTRSQEGLAFAFTGIALGAAIALVGLSRSLVLAAALYGIAGCMSVINGVSAVTLVQSLVPDRLRGRIFGVASSLNHLAAFASTLLIAAGSGLIGTAGLITTSGAIAAVTGLWVLGVVLRVRKD